jgi:hypothetical protein
MFGGFQAPGQRTNEIWEWDGSAWHKAAVTGPSPSPRSHMRMAYDAARGVILMFGGDDTGETWTWDGAKWTQYNVSGPSPRTVAAMAYDSARRRIVIFGGNTRRGVPPYGYDNDTWEWDGQRWMQAKP